MGHNLSYGQALRAKLAQKADPPHFSLIHVSSGGFIRDFFTRHLDSTPRGQYAGQSDGEVRKTRISPPQPLENHMTLDDTKENSAGEATAEEKEPQAKPLDVMPAGVPTPQGGVFSSAVRITNLYVQGGPSVDVQVAKTGSGGNLTVAPGTSAIVLLSDTITAITALATNSGARVTQPVDIG